MIETPEKTHTIGTIKSILMQEFPDISISKIRYLEDQRLITPQRTPGGYRLYTEDDLNRLRAILRLQRDEFLPLRVIREELATGRSVQSTTERSTASTQESRARSARPRIALQDNNQGRQPLQQLVAQSDASEQLIKELEDFSIVHGEGEGNERSYDELDCEIIRAAAELGKYGVGGRNLRVLRSSADREAVLLQQIFAPLLQSRSSERREEAVETLEHLAAITSHLKHLLLVRDLREIVS